MCIAPYFRLIFSVVSDPGFNDDGDCIDVAFAVVDLLKVGVYYFHFERS